MTKFRDLPHLAGRLYDVPLLMDSRKLEAIVPAFQRRLAGEPDVLDPADAARPGDISQNVWGVAVIEVFGSLVRRKNALQAYSGLSSYDDLAQALDSALADGNVKAILLRVDSFGGEAGGCFELCDRIYQARKIKPVWAVADINALSAAYAIGCSAERFYVAPSGQVGSIGVVAVHCETSRMNDAIGVTYTVLRSGERKADGNPFEPLADAARAKVQASMDKNRTKFSNMVSRNRRGLTVAAVTATEGEWYDAEEALGRKLVDGVAVYDDVLAQLIEKISGGTASVPASAAIAPPPDNDGDGDEATIDPTISAAPSAAEYAAARREVLTEAAEIVELCRLAERTEMAAEYIELKMTPAQVRVALGWAGAFDQVGARRPRPYLVADRG